ncbi:MAG: hypothetical protein EOO61_12380 [Hymenobacter sp.]|nr:MAG: hypothetical protein EOO61_12380 [Hymenobacter sp.]
MVEKIPSRWEGVKKSSQPLPQKDQPPFNTAPMARVSSSRSGWAGEYEISQVYVSPFKQAASINLSNTGLLEGS